MQVPQHVLLAGVLLTTHPWLLRPALAQPASDSIKPAQTLGLAQAIDTPIEQMGLASEPVSLLAQTIDPPVESKHTSSKLTSGLVQFTDTTALRESTASEHASSPTQETYSPALFESIYLEQVPVLAQTTPPDPPIRASLEQVPLLVQVPEQTDDSGWYVSLSPSFAFDFSVDVNSDGNVPIEIDAVVPGLPPTIVDTPISLSLDTEAGFGISGAVGYRWSDARAELEVVYNRNGVDGINVEVDDLGLDANFPIDGSIESIQVFLNGYYDIPTGSNFRPYIGAGVGISSLTANDIETDVPGLGELELDDSGVSFVFQAKAGISYDFAENASAFLGYRLYGIPGQNFNAFDADFEADTVLVHSIQLGARYEF
ncbi:MAG: P44/Msp2 family outer membrane protein [Cyanobacteria bacterium P01_F01_bin.86]